VKHTTLLALFLLACVTANAGTNEPPPFLLDRGAKRIEQTAGAWELTRPDGSRERWTRGTDQAWSNGRDRFTPWPAGGWFDARGTVYSKSGNGYTRGPRSSTDFFGRETPSTFIAGSNRYTRTGTGFALAPEPPIRATPRGKRN
jgi:hypothetical protein